MSLYGFSDGEKHKTVSAPLSSKLNRILILGVGVGMAILSFFVIIPEDMFTTALFFDSLELTPVYEGTSFLFGGTTGVWADYPTITASSGAFTLALMLARLFVGYKAAMEQKWASNAETFFHIVKSWLSSKQIHGLNRTKLGFTIAYWGLDIFDTLTDASYRQGDHAHFAVALIVSWLFYSLFSEWMFIQGTKTAVSEAILLFFDDGKKQKNNKGKKQQQGRRQNNRHNNRNNQQSNRRRQRNNQQRQQQNNRQNQRHPDIPFDFPDLRRQQ